jgi:carboxymethylenebutenolidase
VIAIQEWWGLDFEIKAHAAKIAADLGVRVLVPDLYRGKLGSEAEEAQHLMGSLDFPGAVQDVIGAAAFLRANGATKVGVLGFCMGGALTIGAAAHGGPAIFECCAPFYGFNVQLQDIAKQLKVPLQWHSGEDDHAPGFADVAAAKKVGELCAEAGVAHEIYTYAGVGHGFMNASEEGVARKAKLGQGAHSQAQVDLAWSRVYAFFGKYLGTTAK